MVSEKILNAIGEMAKAEAMAKALRDDAKGVKAEIDTARQAWHAARAAAVEAKTAFDKAQADGKAKIDAAKAGRAAFEAAKVALVDAKAEVMQALTAPAPEAPAVEAEAPVVETAPEAEAAPLC